MKQRFTHSGDRGLKKLFTNGGVVFWSQRAGQVFREEDVENDRGDLCSPDRRGRWKPLLCVLNAP